MGETDGGAAHDAVRDAAESRLEVIEQTIRLLPIAAFVTDAGQRTGRPAIVYANDAVLSLTGYSFDELEGQSPRIFERDDDDPELIAAVLEAFVGGRSFQKKTIHRRRDGALYHMSWTMSPISDARGERTHFLWMHHDLTDLAEAEQMRNTLFEALHLSSDSVLITSDDDRILFVNRGFLNLSGLSEGEVIGKPLTVLDFVLLDSRTLEPFTPEQLAQVGASLPRVLASARAHHGGTIYLDIASTSIVDPTTKRRSLVHIAKDVTDAVLQRTAAHDEAHRDALTGLLNRRAAETRLDGAMEDALATGAPFSVIMADLDRFKLVNDRFGHGVGDAVLRGFAGILSANVRAADSPVRWGGEEFLIVLPGASLTVASAFAERLRADVESMSVEPVGSVTVSLGVAEWSGDEGTASLVSRADAALYAAKRGGRNRVERAEEPTRLLPRRRG